MAKRNIIELSAVLSMGEAAQAMKMLRQAADSTGQELEKLKTEFVELQKQEANGDLTVQQAARYKALRKEIKDTETVLAGMQKQLSENRRDMSALSRVLSEGFEKQTGNTVKKMIREVEQKLMNFTGKQREIKTKLILDDGTTTYMNVTREKLAEIRQQGAAWLAEQQAGAAEALKQVEAWSRAAGRLGEKERQNQESETAYHRTNMEHIKQELEAKRAAADEAGQQAIEAQKRVRVLEDEQTRLRQQGKSAQKGGQEDAAARYAEAQSKTAALEAERVALQQKLAEAGEQAARNAQMQVEAAKSLALSESERQTRLKEINKEMNRARGVNTMEFKSADKEVPKVEAATPRDYLDAKAELQKRLALREDADYIQNAMENRNRILANSADRRTDPLGFVGSDSYDFAKHQLEIIRGMKGGTVTGGAAGSAMPEDIKAMKAYLDSLGGEMDTLAKKAKDAGVAVNKVLLGNVVEAAKKASDSIANVYKNGNQVPEGEMQGFTAAVDAVKQRMAAMVQSVAQGQAPKGGDFFEVDKAIRGISAGFGKYTGKRVAANTQDTEAEKPWFADTEKVLDMYKSQLVRNGADEQKVSQELARMKQKLSSQDVASFLNEYEAYYQSIVAEIEKSLAQHDGKVRDLRAKYGTYTAKERDAGGNVVEVNKRRTDEGIASHMRDIAKGGGETENISSLRRKLGVREGDKQNVTLADGTVQTVNKTAVGLPEGEQEEKLLALLRERAALQGKLAQVTQQDNEANAAAVGKIQAQLEANEKAITVQKEAEEQARKNLEAQLEADATAGKLAENEQKLTEAKQQSAQATEKSVQATKEYNEYERKTASDLEASEKYLQEHDASVIKNADDMRRYIKVLQEQAPLLSGNAEEYARYQKAITELKRSYAEFTENTRANMKNLGKVSDATLVQLRNHFQGIITTAGASAKEIKAAQKSIDKIDKEQHKRSMASATAPISSRASIGEIQKRVQEAQQLQKSALTTRTEWKQLQEVIDQGAASLRAFNEQQAKVQAGKDIKALANPSAMSDAEIAQATKRLQDYAATTKLTTDEREKLNRAIAAGNAELERKQGGDNAVRLTEQYRMLTSEVNGLGKASDEVLRKQAAFWLQQSTQAQEGSAQYVAAMKKYREMAGEMTRRQDVQRWETLNGQLGGADREQVLMGQVGTATEQQIRAAIEQTTILNRQTSLTSAEYAKNADLIARGNSMLGEQKRLQEERAKAEELLRQRADAQSVEGDLTRASKQQLDVLKQMYTEKLQINERDTAARDSLVAIVREEQRRLDIQKQISAEAARLSDHEVNARLNAPLRYTSEQVDQAIRQGEQQVRKLAGRGGDDDIEQARQLAVAIDQAKEAQRRFNEENQRAVMRSKLYTSGSVMSKAALAEQEKYWQAQVEGARQGSSEAAKFADRLRFVRGMQKAAAQEQLGISRNGSGALTAGHTGMIADIMNGSLTTIEQMKQAKAAVEEFKAKFADTRDTDGMRMLDQAIAQVTHDLAMAEKGMMSLDDVTGKLEAKSKARADEAKAIADGKRVDNPTQNFSQPEIERMSRSLREAYQYYEAMGDTAGIQRTQRAMGMLAAETERTKQSAAQLAAGEARIAATIANPRAEKSLKVLQAAYQQLKQKIDNAEDSQKAYMENAGKLREINKAIQQVTRSMEHQKSVAERVKAALVSHWGIYLNLATIIQQVQSMIMGNVQLSDSMTNVQKVTSMTNSELKTMTERLEELDTRTSQLDLMKLAEQAGKLGIYNRGGVEAMTDFVDVANRITSTLGEDIGGAQAVDSLVKVNDLVNKDSGMGLYESLSRIGSGILSVGNNSAASYADVVNFVNQVGAVGSVSGVSMEQLIALGGTFSSLGAAMDQSATSINKLLVGLQRNAGKVASVTGQSAAELQSMIESGDTFEALLSVVERVHEMGGNTAQTIYDILDTFGGRKNAQMFTAMALLVDNASRLREEMFYANQGYQENTLMASEYNRVQENLAGTLARIGNSIKEAFMNPGVQDAMKTIVEVLGYIARAFVTIIGVFSYGWVKVTTGFFALVAAIRAAKMALVDFLAKEQATATASLATRIKNTGHYFIKWAQSIFQTGDALKKTRGEMEALKTVSLGWVTVIIVVITALVQWWQKSKEAQAAQKRAIGEYNATISQNIAQSDAMFGALERTIDPLQKAREEHEKTVTALNNVTEANKNGQASYEQVTQAEQENREAKERLNEAANDQARALNAVNSAYGNTLRLSQADLANANLLEAAHKRVAAAIREEAAARLASKLRENVTNQHADKIQEREGALTSRKDKFGEKEEKEKGIGEAMVNYARQIAHEYSKKAKSEGKNASYYKNEIETKLGKEYARLWGRKYEGFSKVSANNRASLLFSEVMDLIQEYTDYEKALDSVEETVANQARANAKEASKERHGALEDYKKAWEKVRSKAIKVPKDLKAVTQQQIQSYITPLREYVNTYKGMLKTDPNDITEKERETYDKYSAQLETLQNALQEKLMTDVWGKDGLTRQKMSDNTLVQQYKDYNDWHNQLRPGMNVKEALPQFAEIVEKDENLRTLDDEQLRQFIYNRAKLLKEELDRRHLNTSGKFKWTEGSGGKDKWKQETKDQYNAYIKELDDFYARQKMELEQQRADGLMVETEFNARVEELDKEHYYNRSRLRNMFMEDAKRDERTGLLSDPSINRIYGEGRMEQKDIDAWKKDFEKTRSLVNRLGDAFVDEVKLKSTEDRLKVAQILRKAQDELDKAVLEGDPMAKVLDEYEDKLDKMHQIFGMQDWMSGNEHSDEEYRKRLDILRGYSAQILSTSENEFVRQISQTEEFAGRTVDEYRLLYDSLLQLRDDHDEAARKQAKKDLRLMDARIENGSYYRDQLNMYESRLKGMDWSSPEAQSVMSMVEMLRGRQNVKDEKTGKEVSYNARQKARLEAAKKQAEREDAVKSSGVTNEIGSAHAQLEVARQELTMAYDTLTARRSYMDANIAETEKEMESLRQSNASMEEINAKEADLAAMKVMQSEAITEANEKVEESERKLSEAEANLLAARVANANEWQSIFTEYMKSVASAGDSQAESNAFKIAEIKARKALGLYKETAKQRYLILQQNGKYEEKWMDEQESLLMDNKIAAENEMKQATEKMLNDFGEKMAKSITEAFQRMMELQVEQEKEQQKQQAITNEQKQGIDQRMVNEQNYTTFYKNELALRLQEAREFYRQLNTLTAGSPAVVLGKQDVAAQQTAGVMPGDILNNMEGMGADSDGRVGVMPGDIAANLYGDNAELTSQWTDGATAVDAYYNHVVTSEQTANAERTKSHAKMVSAMSAAMNMYGIVYSTVMNDNLTAAQKAKQIALQTTGQMIISLLTASLAQAGSDTATGLAGAIAKAFSQLGPIGGAAAIAGITATIGAAMALATSKVAKSKKEVAAATGAGAGKLTTGMLTYADGRYPGDVGFSEGNSYTVDGADGKTYSAQYEGSITKTGIRRGTHFGIFSEKKPEMVIDGDTTARIHRDYPQIEQAIRYVSMRRNMPPLPEINHRLIQHSMEVISRGRAMGMAGAGRLTMKTFADGNVEDVVRTLGAASTQSTQTVVSSVQQQEVLAQLSATVAELQKTLAAGIRADVSSKSFAKAKRFEQRNGIKGGLLD